MSCGLWFHEGINQIHRSQGHANLQNIILKMSKAGHLLMGSKRYYLLLVASKLKQN